MWWVACGTYYESWLWCAGLADAQGGLLFVMDAEMLIYRDNLIGFDSKKIYPIAFGLIYIYTYIYISPPTTYTYIYIYWQWPPSSGTPLVVDEPALAQKGSSGAELLNCMRTNNN